MRLIDADAVYKILESCEIRKATIGNPLTDWEYGYTCGIERGESEIECAPTVETIYGYPVKDLIAHAVFCTKQGIDPWELKETTKAWVPVTERLPEKDGRYLTTLINHSKVGGWIVDWNIWHSKPKPSWLWEQGVTAWMPMPEPYKGEDE